MSNIFSHDYTCPVCGNTVELQSYLFDDHVAGQCKFCNLKIDMLRVDYDEWVRGKNEG